jgi:hypothetical protein
MCIEADPEYWNPSREHSMWLLFSIVGALANADVLVFSLRHRKTTNACLTNLIAGNILAILCLPIDYFHHFYRDRRLEFPMEVAFFVSRDVATGVQMFSLVAYSALKLSRVKSLGRCEAANAFSRVSHTTVSTGHQVRLRVTDTCLTLVIWLLAVFCSLPTALIPETSYYVYSGDEFEDTNTKFRVMYHCVTFCIIPEILTVFFYILIEIRRSNSAGKIKDGSGKLVFWLACAVMINYVPLHCWILYSWSQNILRTVAVVDFATYFPLYSTACWTPIVLYFVMKNTRKQLAAA